MNTVKKCLWIGIRHIYCDLPRFFSTLNEFSQDHERKPQYIKRRCNYDHLTAGFLKGLCRNGKLVRRNDTIRPTPCFHCENIFVGFTLKERYSGKLMALKYLRPIAWCCHNWSPTHCKSNPTKPLLYSHLNDNCPATDSLGGRFSYWMPFSSYQHNSLQQI